MDEKPCVHIVVMGDIGRSPRMKYHACSFAQEGWLVQLSGYAGSGINETVLKNPDIELNYISECPRWINSIKPRLLMYFCKLTYMFLAILLHLMHCTWCPIILVQNPPGVPTLIAAWVASKIRKSYLVVDWHNYGYSVLALASGPDSFQTKLYKWLECSFSSKFLQRAQHLCVSHGLKADLYCKWGIIAKTLQDRPPDRFKKANLKETYCLFNKLSDVYPQFNESSTGIYVVRNNTAQGGDAALDVDVQVDANSDQRGMSNGQLYVDADTGMRVSRRQDGPALLVSSSSWTEDDSVDLLIDALDLYDQALTEQGGLPPIICVLTGRGPTKAFYTELIASKQWNNVTVVMPWLESEDYPTMLGSVDLGICLHDSTSGLDLPMKVVDMFGAQLPVLALDYECLHELVQDEHNGLLFTTAPQLADQMATLLAPLSQASDWLPEDSQLAKFRRHIQEWRQDTWHRNWRRVVLPTMQGLIQ